MVTFWSNNKKDWNSLKIRLVFVHSEVFKGESRNSAIFKMELFAAIGNCGACNQWSLFACCYGNSTSFNGKIKIGWKWLHLECGIRYIFLFYRHTFTFFFENINYFLFHQHSVSFQRLITKMKTGIIVDFIFQGFINRSNHQHMFRKNVVNKMQEKHLWRSSF